MTIFLYLIVFCVSENFDDLITNKKQAKMLAFGVDDGTWTHKEIPQESETCASANSATSTYLIQVVTKQTKIIVAYHYWKVNYLII